MYSNTERWVNGACAEIVAAGQVRLYRDLYKDLRRHLPCGEAAGLISAGLVKTRASHPAGGGMAVWKTVVDRAQAIAALKRLARWARLRDLGLTACREGWIVREE